MQLKSQYGNVVRITNNPAKIVRLKEQGYTEVKEKSKTEKKEPKA